MAGGLDLMGGANVRAGAQMRYGSAPAPTTATEAAFGSSLEPAHGGASLAPTDPGGLAIWAGVAGLVFLVALYYSLPKTA